MNYRWVLGYGLLIACGCSHAPMAATPNNLLSPAEHVTLANTYLMQNDQTLAVRQYECALQVDSHYVPALVALGNIAFENNDLKKAERYFERALKLSPKDAAVLNNVAMVRLAEGKELKGIDIRLEDAVPNAGSAAPYLWDTLARIAMIEGRYMDARDALEKAAETAPAQDPAFQKHLAESRQELVSVVPEVTSQ
jgi:Tfp pilus assembly protein PilF